MKRLFCIIISTLMLISVFAAAPVSAEENTSAPTGFTAEEALYAHAVLSSDDGEAWLKWQSETAEGAYEVDSSVKYFFLPSSADKSTVDIYNAYSAPVTVNGTVINNGSAASVSYETGKTYDVSAGGSSFKLTFMRSNAEAAIYVNNSNADGKGSSLISYLNITKSNSAKATGAIVTPDGKIDNTPIKKIKGRGNTTWGKPKKAYNITYDSKVSISGMKAGKKYSILANYQDDSLSRNRFLYDLSDAVGMPYASDSRYVDFYSNGRYLGAYQLCEKVEVGKNSLVSDFEEEDYLDENGNVKEDFPFLCEVDAGAQDGDDYYVTISNRIKITIKAPELDEGDPGFDEVKNYVRDKFDAFYKATQTRTNDLSKYADVDSLAKIYLINELGKNWDSGVSSLFFTYKKDSDGEYKFFASPVWDYDNSLGNAAGIESYLRNAGVTDYTEFSGWWCKFNGKSKNQKTSTNIMNRLAQNTNVLSTAKTLWFEKFVPAIDHFSGKRFSEEINTELYTADAYYELLRDSAAMNYTSGWLLNTGSWISDHTKLYPASYDADTNTYYYHSASASYNNDFEGMYNYCRDWMISRAAWLSKEMSDSPAAEVDLDAQPTEATNATEATEPSTTQPATEASAPTEETEAPTQPSATTPTQPSATAPTQVFRLVLDKTQYTYTGKAVTPGFTVKDSKGNILSKGLFDINFSAGRKKIGTYSALLYFKSTGIKAASASFRIIPPSPSAKSITVSKRTAKKAAIRWNKVKGGVTGYQIAYSKTKNFKSSTKKAVKKTSAKIIKLKKTRAYFFKIRSYKTVNDKKIYSGWSKIKNIPLPN